MRSFISLIDGLRRFLPSFLLLRRLSHYLKPLQSRYQDSGSLILVLHPFNFARVLSRIIFRNKAAGIHVVWLLLAPVLLLLAACVAINFVRWLSHQQEAKQP